MSLETVSALLLVVGLFLTASGAWIAASSFTWRTPRDAPTGAKAGTVWTNPQLGEKAFLCILYGTVVQILGVVVSLFE
jgi:hypothetical protein